MKRIISFIALICLFAGVAVSIIETFASGTWAWPIWGPSLLLVFCLSIPITDRICGENTVWQSVRDVLVYLTVYGAYLAFIKIIPNFM